MNRYTYTLNPGQKEPEMKQTYKRSRLEQMTTFQLCLLYTSDAADEL